MPTATQPISQKKVQQMGKNLKRHEEILDHCRAISVCQNEKKMEN
jgi:hypothetical protein